MLVNELVKLESDPSVCAGGQTKCQVCLGFLEIHANALAHINKVL